jgi:type IV pilus assembly protein PilV
MRAGMRPLTGARGFSLVEVLVALIVLSVGLLGIAKMEALALSSTAVSSRRALAAIEAASLADTMHVNRGYWAASAAGVNITVSGTTVTNPPLGATPDCAGAGAPCTSAGLATYDLQQWANNLNQLLPAYQATIQCNNSTPVECSIQIQWSEQAIGLNNGQAQATSTAASETAGTSAAMQNPTYTLYVEP